MSAAIPILRVIPDGNDTIPPASPAAEQAAIGSVLIWQEMPADLEDLKPDDFHLPAHREIWEAIRALQARSQRIDHIALEEEIKSRGSLGRLEGGGEYLLVCAGATPTAENSGHYARIIRDKSGLRRLIQLCAEVKSRCYGGHVGFDEALGAARNGIASMETAGSGVGPVRVGDEIGAAIEAIEAKHKAPERYAVMTGISRFDKKLGGLRPGRLIVTAGSPGLGKSAWAGNIAAYNAFRNVPSLIISVEMDRQELIERFLAGEASISTKEIGTGEVCGDLENFHLLYAAGRKFAAPDVPLFVDDREALTISQTVGTIRRWYAKHLGPVPPKDKPPNPAFVAVDYLQLLTGDEPESDDNRNTVLAGMTRAFKRLAKSLRIPLVLLSQLNRANVKRGGKPILADLRDSGAIEQDADQVIFLWREQEQDRDGREIKGVAGKAWWLVGKNRGGPTGSIPVWWEPKYTRFQNCTEFGGSDE
jgi:replicative DNA helicase